MAMADLCSSGLLVEQRPESREGGWSTLNHGSCETGGDADCGRSFLDILKLYILNFLVVFSGTSCTSTHRTRTSLY